MGYHSLRQCVEDLQSKGQLVCLTQEIDAHLVAAAIHRRVVAAGGPALLFDNVKGCRFPMVSNLFGTRDRLQLMFRDGLDAVKQLDRITCATKAGMRQPWRYLGVPRMR